MSISDEKLRHYIEHAEFVGVFGTPAITTGQLAELATELMAAREALKDLLSIDFDSPTEHDMTLLDHVIKSARAALELKEKSRG